MRTLFQLLLTLSFGFATLTANADQTAPFMISIDKLGTAAVDIQKNIEALNIRDTNTSQCYAESQVVDYIDFQNLPDTPYYGVAIVDITWSCDESLKALLERIESSEKYTIYSNPVIDVFPGISGNNSPQQ